MPGRPGRAFSQTVPGLDPRKTITQYSLDVWQTEQGLPQTTVYAVAQTADGYLWVGSQAGLTRFDGVTFTTYSSVNVPGLKDRYVNALLADRDGDLWIGTESGGISRLHQGSFTAFEDDLGTPKIECIFQDRSGEIWAGSSGGLLRLDSGRFRAVPGLAMAIHSLIEQADGTLLMATSDGIRSWRAGRAAPWHPARDLSLRSALSLLQDRQGAFWIGTTQGLIRITRRGVESFTARDGLPPGEVRRIMETRNGQIWIGTFGGGVARFRNGRFETFSIKDGLEGSDVSTILEDREGGLWVATENGGLNHFRDAIVTTFGQREGLPTDMLWSVYGDREQNIWIGSDRGGLIRLRNGKVTTFTAHHGFPSSSAYSTLETSDGTLWAGSDNGLSRFHNGRWEDLSNRRGAPTKWVSALFEDSAGGLWIGAGTGLYRWKDGVFHSYSKEAGITTRVWTIVADKEGSIWFGTLGEGLVRLHDGRFTRYTTKDGLSNNSIYSLYANHDGLWIGVLFGGLHLLRNGRITALPFSNRLALSDLWQIQEDGRGMLWMSSSQGLYTVPKSELLDAANGHRSSVTVRRFDELDGLRRTEFNGAGHNAGWKSADGRLWYPTVKGLVVVDPNRLQTNPLPPPVHITYLLVNGREEVPADGLELPPGGGGLEIHYTATSLLIPRRVTFRYKLEGYDEDWVDADTRRVAFYTRVPGGHYRFRVIAANNDGVWNEIGTTLDFRIQPHFYETLWFYATGGLLGLALVGGVIRLRVRHMVRSARALSALVDERTAELRTSETRYRGLFEANPQPVWVYDRETLAFLAVNEAAIRHYGYSRDQFLAMRLPGIYAPADAEESKPELDHGRKHPLPRLRLHRNSTGQTIEVEEAVHEINFGGRDAQLVVALDVTTRRDLEERLRQAQKMEAIGQLTGGIAHDLNNVLTAVIAHVDLAVATLSPEPTLLADLTQAQAAAHRGAGIIRKLLGFSRRERLVLKPLDLGQFVNEFSGTLKRLLPAPVEISVAVDSGLPPVAADIGTVQQMLLNLATNARDAMPHGGRLRIEVGRTSLDSDHLATHGWGQPGSYIFLAVTDSGIGMDSATQKRVFEPFFSTKPQGQGSGLGMAMVYGLMKQHQGYVSVGSEPGQGTEIKLYFPVSDAVMPQVIPERRTIHHHGHETILVVEDEESVRNAATRALKRFGYRVIVAADGEEGLRLWRTNADRIDLIISDAIMPRMGGLALFDVVSRERADVPFLLMSGYTGEEVSGRGTWTSDLAFLPKPWTVNELLAGVRDTLQGSSAT